MWKKVGKKIAHGNFRAEQKKFNRENNTPRSKGARKKILGQEKITILKALEEGIRF